jgi:hypothetical protein
MRHAILAMAWIGLATPTEAAGVAPPVEGSTSYSAYFTCRPVGRADFGPIGSRSVAECVGVAKDTGEAKAFDNLSARCLENEEIRGGPARYDGWCAETDADGDQFFTSYQGTDGGKVTFLGGTGKFKGISGGGDWRLVEAPVVFAFTLEYKVSWRLE